MFKIRESQMEVFRAYQRKVFRERLDAHLTEKYALPDTAEIVDSSLTAASTFGITMEEDIVTLAELMAEEGTGFPEDPERPEAGQILSDFLLSEDAKIQLLVLRRPWRNLSAAEPAVEPE